MSAKQVVTLWRERLAEPIDIASLVIVRISFGLIMLWEVARYFEKGWIHKYWIAPDFHFRYFGFGWVAPWPGDGMYWHFVGLGVLALLITFGLFYRVATALFFIAFSYVFLLEQARYLNHFYLVCLVSFLMAVVPANRAVSLDAKFGFCEGADTVPAWSLWILRFQVGVVYFYGGIAKLNADWLAGEPLRSWLQKRMDYPLIGPLFGQEPVVMLMNYGALFFDLLIVPLLMWRRTRALAFAGVLFFNLTNAVLFHIGIFPWFAIALSTVFFAPDWPRRYVILKRNRAASPLGADRCSRVVFAFLAAYVCWQLFMPLRHWLYPGNVNWTEEGHLYAWHMKLRSKSGRARFLVTDEAGKEYKVSPTRYIKSWQARKMAARPDMIHQFVYYLGDRLRMEGIEVASIRVDARVSLNGRKRQRLIDPDADLLKAPRSIWPQKWIKPLEVPLHERRRKGRKK